MNIVSTPTAYESDLRRELKLHFERLTLDYERSGRSTADARRLALIAYGGLLFAAARRR